MDELELLGPQLYEKLAAEKPWKSGAATDVCYGKKHHMDNCGHKCVSLMLGNLFFALKEIEEARVSRRQGYTVKGYATAMKGVRFEALESGYHSDCPRTLWSNKINSILDRKIHMAGNSLQHFRNLSASAGSLHREQPCTSKTGVQSVKGLHKDSNTPSKVITLKVRR
jgi:hypothetical protein